MFAYINIIIIKSINSLNFAWSTFWLLAKQANRQRKHNFFPSFYLAFSLLLYRHLGTAQFVNASNFMKNWCCCCYTLFCTLALPNTRTRHISFSLEHFIFYKKRLFGLALNKVGSFRHMLYLYIDSRTATSDCCFRTA